MSETVLQQVGVLQQVNVLFASDSTPADVVVAFDAEVPKGSQSSRSMNHLTLTFNWQVRARAEAGALYVELSGINEVACMAMGVYERVVDRHTQDGRGVYRQMCRDDGEKGECWMWWHEGEWCISNVENDVGLHRSDRAQQWVNSDAVVLEEVDEQWHLKRYYDSQFVYHALVRVLGMGEAEQLRVQLDCKRMKREVLQLVIGNTFFTLNPITQLVIELVTWGKYLLLVTRIHILCWRDELCQVEEELLELRRQFQQHGLASLEDTLPRPPVPSHGGNAAVEPERWGMTKAQMRQFIKACMLTREWEELAVQGSQYKEAGHVNGYDLCSSYVVPWTQGTGCSVSLLMNDTPVQADVMISHAWGEDMEQVLGMLKDDSDMPGETVVWFCILSNYQPEDGHGPSLDEQLAREPFGLVIRQASRMLVLHTTTAKVYDRLWCCFEMGEAVLQLEAEGREFKVVHDHSWLVLREVEVKRVSRRLQMFIMPFLVTLILGAAINIATWLHPNTPSIVSLSLFIVMGSAFILFACYYYARYDRELQVHTASAQCGKPSDANDINVKLQGSGGFAALDDRILALRIDAQDKHDRLYHKVVYSAGVLVTGLLTLVWGASKMIDSYSEGCLLAPFSEC